MAKRRFRLSGRVPDRQTIFMSRQKELLAHLLDAFPPKVFCGEVVPHDCPAHPELRTVLSGATWWSVPASFVQKHSGALALLTKEAYKAFLPAWLGEAISNPAGESASFLMRNLREGGFAPDFSQQESYAVIQVVKWIAEKNGVDPDDHSGNESVAGILQKWGQTD